MNSPFDKGNKLPSMRQQQCSQVLFSLFPIVCCGKKKPNPKEAPNSLCVYPETVKKHSDWKQLKLHISNWLCSGGRVSKCLKHHVRSLWGIFLHIILHFYLILFCHEHHHTQGGVVWGNTGCASLSELGSSAFLLLLWEMKFIRWDQWQGKYLLSGNKAKGESFCMV